MAIIIGALMVLFLAAVGINFSRGSVSRDRGPMPSPFVVTHRPQPAHPEADTRILEREEMWRHFILKRPGLVR